MKEDGEKKVNASLYRSLVGSLLYLTATRPDIMFAASFLSRFMQSPSQIHFGAAKRVWRYLQGTIGYGIWYNYSSDLKLVGYSDSDWAGSADDMRSASGYAFFLGSGVFSWASKKQQTVAQSSAEAEYVAASMATSQAIWLRRIFEDVGQSQEEGTERFCDNKSAIAIGKNPVCHNRTKHIAIKYHFIREAIENGEIQLTKRDNRNSLRKVDLRAREKSQRRNQWTRMRLSKNTFGGRDRLFLLSSSEMSGRKGWLEREIEIRWNRNQGICQTNPKLARKEVAPLSGKPAGGAKMHTPEWRLNASVEKKSGLACSITGDKHWACWAESSYPYLLVPSGGLFLSKGPQRSVEIERYPSLTKGTLFR